MPESLHFVRDLLVILAATVPLVILMHRLRQSPILAYLLTGIAIGPAGLKLIRPDSIEGVSEIGVIALLFTVGLEFSVSKLLRMKRYALAGGALQMALTAVPVAACALLAGTNAYEAFFLGSVIALSSTAIVLKVLSDRRETDALHAQVTLGVLVFQDLAVIPILILLRSLGGAETGGAAVAVAFLFAILKAVVIFVVLYVGMKVVIDRILYQVAATRSAEVFALAVIALGIGAAWASERVGLSLAFGAFLAGVILSESEYSHHMLVQILPFKDVFLAIFFVSIGMLLRPAWVFQHLGLVLPVVLGVILLKAVVGAGVARILGVTGRVAAAVGLALAQVGEFSFVLARVAYGLDLVSENLYQLALSATVLTMATAPLLIAWTRRIVSALGRVPGLARAVRPAAEEELEAAGKQLEGHVIICGLGPVGRDIAAFLLDSRVPFIALELNPMTVRELRASGLPTFFGDASQPIVLHEAGLDRARALVVTSPDAASTERIVRVARAASPQAKIFARTKFRADVPRMAAAGADEVIEEEFETAIEIVVRLGRTLKIPRRVVAREMADLRIERYRFETEASAENGSGHGLPPLDIEVHPVPAASPAAGRSIGDLDIRRRTGATLLAVAKPDGAKVNPGPEIALSAGDYVAVAGTAEQLDRFARFLAGEAGVETSDAGDRGL